jgi:hypothetical protein
MDIDWTGAWVNEYGSSLVITAAGNGRIEGTFATALGDSSFRRDDRADLRLEPRQLPAFRLRRGWWSECGGVVHRFAARGQAAPGVARRLRPGRETAESGR